jgi:chromate transporter
MSQPSEAPDDGRPAVLRPSQQASLGSIFMAFARAGISAIGGGTSTWIMHEVVRKRQWLTETEFMSGFAISQALPGVNVVNLAIWFGYILRGPTGAVAGAAGMILPTTALALVVVATFSQFMSVPVIQAAVVGSGVATLGMGLYMTWRSAKVISNDVIRIAIAAAAFAALYVFKISLVIVFVVSVPLSVGIAYWRLRARKPTTP